MMQIQADWHVALTAARRGDLEPARNARSMDSKGALPDFLYARCLTEAGADLDEAIELLRLLVESRSKNPLIPQVLALALARTERPEEAVKAAELWEQSGLPHPIDLLGQVALTLEAQTRPWPDQNPGLDLAWPGVLPPRDKFASEPNPAVEPLQPCDNLTPEPATKKLGWFELKRIDSLVNKIEELISKGHARGANELAINALAKGKETPELNAVAGIAADELGDPARARAHLARSLELEPKLLIARAHLARVYWRSGWFELAMALWRSLPVEGPYDYGRHYHLALGYDALGRRAEAERAMAVALSDFFYDMRHYYIAQAFRRWKALRGAKSEFMPNAK
ncbi:hypothetical protein LLG95_01185 [bacterium]|nr:hypothetical protein [bacterium]